MNRCLDLGAVNVLAAGDDHVLGAINNEYVAFFVPGGDIASPHPIPAYGLFREVRSAPVPQHVGFGANRDLARGLSISRYGFAFRVNDTDLRNKALSAAGTKPLGMVTGHGALVILL